LACRMPPSSTGAGASMHLRSLGFLVLLLVASCGPRCPDPNDPCCGDPCCGDPCCGDRCCGDPCCGDPCCGNCIDGSDYQSRLSRQRFSSITERAAYNLVCSADQVAVENLDNQRYQAAGCGKTATYACACVGHDVRSCATPTCRAEGPVSGDPSALGANRIGKNSGVGRK
jgi:hypothetical protein